MSRPRRSAAAAALAEFAEQPVASVLSHGLEARAQAPAHQQGQDLGALIREAVELVVARGGSR